MVTRGEFAPDSVDVLGFGGASSDEPHPELSADELAREAAARRAALDRRRPAGFAPWTESRVVPVESLLTEDDLAVMAMGDE